MQVGQLSLSTGGTSLSLSNSPIGNINNASINTERMTLGTNTGRPTIPLNWEYVIVSI